MASSTAFAANGSYSSRAFCIYIYIPMHTKPTTVLKKYLCRLHTYKLYVNQVDQTTESHLSSINTYLYIVHDCHGLSMFMHVCNWQKVACMLKTSKNLVETCTLHYIAYRWASGLQLPILGNLTALPWGSVDANKGPNKTSKIIQTYKNI